MGPEDSSLEQHYVIPDYATTLVNPPPDAPVVKVSRAPSLFKFNRRAFLITGGTVSLILLIVGGVLGVSYLQNSTVKEPSRGEGSYSVSKLTVGDVSDDELKVVSASETLAVNGQLQIKNTLVLSPGGVPTNPTAGQVYYDKATNTPYFYNGTAFVAISTSIGGISGPLSLGGGLNLVNSTIVNSGVISIQGQSGAVNFASGPGIAINGSTISNSGVLGIAGNPNQLAITSSGGNVQLSILGIQPGGVLVGTTGNGISTVLPGSPGECLISNGSISPVFASCGGGGTPANYVASLGTLAGLSVTGNSGQGSTPNLTVLYGSTSTTALRGDTTLTCSSGTGNLSGGGGTITLANNTTCPDLTVVNSPNFSGSVTALGGIGVTGNSTIAGTLTALTGLSSSGTVTLSDLADGIVQSISGVLSSGAVSRNSATLLSGTLSVANGGTGSTSFNTNGILYGNGAGAVLSTGLSANAILATDGSGVPDLVSTLPTAVQGNITSTGALTTGSIASGFGTIVTGNSITGVGVSSGAGLLQSTGGLNVSGAASSINASSNFNTSINTGTSTGVVSIGNSAAGTISLQSSGSINLTPGGTGNTGVIIQPGSANSTNAFRVNNQGGSALLAVDTNGGEVQTSRLVVAVGNATSALDIVQNSTGNILRAYDGGTAVATIADGGAATFQNSTNSTSGFQIQNAAGSSNLFIADTTNTRIGIGRAATTYTLEVGGDVYSTSGFTAESGSNTSRLLANNLQFNSTGTSHIDQLGAGGSLDITTRDTAGSSSLTRLTIGSGDNASVAFTNGVYSFKPGSNSTAAFQIQNATNTPLLVADTTNMRLSIGSVGTATSQLYVSGQLPASETGSVATGTNPRSVDVVGNYAYVANRGSDTLQIFDISNRASPVSVSSTATVAWPTKVEVKGRYAYIGTDASQFQIFDISNPTTPVSVSTTSTSVNTQAMTVSGKYAYLGGSTTLMVYDISNPATPVLAGTTTVGFNPDDIFIDGKYAYVGENNALGSVVFQVVDISNPASMVVYSAPWTENYINSVVVVDGFAYVTTDNEDLSIYNVKNPTSPVRLSSTITGTNPRSLRIQGNYAYLVNEGGNTIQVFNISNPTSPASLGTTATGTAPYGLDVEGRYAYVVNDTTGNMQIFDLGGAYIQQLEAGGIMSSTISTTNNINIGTDLSVGGGISVGGSVGVQGDIGVNGQALFKNAADSSIAFHVQNSAGGSLFNIDSSNTNITINGANTSTVQAWQTGNNSGFLARESHTAVVANGYIYIIGGIDSTGSVTVNTVQYAKILANGNVGNWSTVASLPAARDHPSAAFANGYIYVTGGATDETAATGHNDVYYAKVPSDGNITSWTTSANPIFVGSAQERWRHSSVVANGYLYVIGGQDTSGSVRNTVYKSKLYPDGSNGTWSSAGANLSSATFSHASAVANGYVYAIAGNSSTTTQYAKLNADGSTSSWNTSTTLPAVRHDSGIAVLNGTIYVIGGENSGYHANTFYATLGANGAVGAWNCQGTVGSCGSATPVNSTSIPGTRAEFSSIPVTANGYIYVIGGWNAATNNTVYYTSTSRVSINGSLDLVGTSGQNLSEGNSGGALTAGNTNIIGTLNVQDTANFVQSVSMGADLNVGGMISVIGNMSVKGQVTLTNSSNSVTAFQVQNASGTTLLGIDTQNSRIFSNVADGSSAIGFKLNVTNAFSSSGAKLLSVQNATVEKFAIDKDGHITVYGHYKSLQTTAPTIGTPSNCGTSPSASVVAASTDSAGAFGITAGTGGAQTTCDTVVTFNVTGGNAPKSVIVVAQTKNGGTGTAAARQVYVSNSSTSSFTVKMNSAPADSEVNYFYYWVIE